MKRTTKVSIGTIAVLLAIVAGLAAVKAIQIVSMIDAGKSFTPPPESVTSAIVARDEWESTTSAVGTVVAVRAVTLSAEVPGTVREIRFDSGSAVKRGAVLVELDSSTEQALLESARAAAALADVSLVRVRNLEKAGAQPKAELDAADARARQARADVDNQRALLTKKTIRAPFDGKVALRQVELGQVLSPGTPIASLYSVDPIYVEFPLPQRALSELDIGMRVRATTDAYAKASWTGQLTLINTEVDATTRNVVLRATFPNKDGRLLPGMFVKVDVVSDAARPVLAIPATSVLFAPYGDSVFLIEEKTGDDGKKALRARQQIVRLGEQRGDFVAVTSGLSEGQTIVSSGVFKLKNDMPVVVNNKLAPKAELAPTPPQE